MSERSKWKLCFFQYITTCIFFVLIQYWVQSLYNSYMQGQDKIMCKMLFCAFPDFRQILNWLILKNLMLVFLRCCLVSYISSAWNSVELYTFIQVLVTLTDLMVTGVWKREKRRYFLLWMQVELSICSSV